jgi:hypothetical protein
MHEYVAANGALALRAQVAVESGDVDDLGIAMKEAQELFDRTAGKVRSELSKSFPFESLNYASLIYRSVLPSFPLRGCTRCLQTPTFVAAASRPRALGLKAMDPCRSCAPPKITNARYYIH